MRCIYMLYAEQPTNIHSSEKYTLGGSSEGKAIGKGMKAEGRAEEERLALRFLATHQH